MILQRVEQADWLSNAYLIVDEAGGKGVLVDSNAITDPLAERDVAGDDGARHDEHRLGQARGEAGQRDDRGALVDRHGASVAGRILAA